MAEILVSKTTWRMVWWRPHLDVLFLLFVLLGLNLLIMVLLLDMPFGAKFEAQEGLPSEMSSLVEEICCCEGSEKGSDTGSEALARERERERKREEGENKVSCFWWISICHRGLESPNPCLGQKITHYNFTRTKNRQKLVIHNYNFTMMTPSLHLTLSQTLPNNDSFLASTNDDTSSDDKPLTSRLKFGPKELSVAAL